MRILIADDDVSIRRSIRLTLMGEPYLLFEAGELEEAYQKMLCENVDLILLDIHFKEDTSLSLMKRMLEENIRIPTVVLSGAASATEAAEAIKYGAYDYIEKPISSERLKLTLTRCLEDAKLKTCLYSMTVQNNKVTDIIGNSNSMVKIRNQVAQYGKKDIKVLITGETGVGKEVIAHALWQNSPRSNRPFIIVNSAAIPENLMESELFGHKKGAFTGAVQDQVGKIEMADKGTLFLDEIGDLSLAAQTKLLRFLETGEVQKIGTYQMRNVDVRLIFATSRNLEKELEKKRFRPDLFYRLNVMRIQIPPLRERVDDIPLLFSYFVQGSCRKFNETEKIIESQVFEELKSYSWPGNIRELRNVAERVVVAADKRILKEHLTQVFDDRYKTQTIECQPESPAESLSLKEYKYKTEREYIQSVLRRAGGSVTRAAQILKIDRTYLHQKISHYGITREH